MDVTIREACFDDAALVLDDEMRMRRRSGGAVLPAKPDHGRGRPDLHRP